ncbi:MAG: glycosyl transferase [Actinomycetia bacterium]|nr:glycosyl transferase [Actinomycetes bacterium]
MCSIVSWPTRTSRQEVVSVVICALNEAESIGQVLDSLPEDVDEVILVDGSSTDGTIEVALGHRPDIRVVCQKGVGKGAALTSGFAAASGDIIITMDGDGSADASEIPRFIETLRNGADLAKGSRFIEGGGSDDFTPVRRLGNRALCTATNLLYGTRYSDLCYGFNAIWSRSLGAVAIDCSGFEVETLMNIRAAKSGLKVVEVPSFELRRLGGKSKLSPVRDGWRILRVILAERVSRTNEVARTNGRALPR